MNALNAAWPRQLADWHEGRAALRMLVAAVVAYVMTTLIHIPGPYSAVITTLIVARPHSAGVLRASLQRVWATLLGAAIATIATLGRIVHVPELLLIAMALAPLALIVAHDSTYRTSMISAIIVLSAPIAHGAPLYVAGIRMLGVTIGAVIGALVSISIFPSPREIIAARGIAKALDELGPLLRYALCGESAMSGARTRLEFRVRQILRELGLLVRDRPEGPPVPGAAAAMVKFLVQMHADINFLRREMPDGSAASARVDAFVQAFETAARRLAAAARGQSGPPLDMAILRERCREAAMDLGESQPNSEGARLMLRRLLEDFGGLHRAVAAGLNAPTARRASQTTDSTPGS